MEAGKRLALVIYLGVISHPVKVHGFFRPLTSGQTGSDYFPALQEPRNGTGK